MYPYPPETQTKKQIYQNPSKTTLNLKIIQKPKKTPLKKPLLLLLAPLLPLKSPKQTLIKNHSLAPAPSHCPPKSSTSPHTDCNCGVKGLAEVGGAAPSTKSKWIIREPSLFRTMLSSMGSLMRVFWIHGRFMSRIFVDCYLLSDRLGLRSLILPFYLSIVEAHHHFTHQCLKFQFKLLFTLDNPQVVS